MNLQTNQDIFKLIKLVRLVIVRFMKKMILKGLMKKFKFHIFLKEQNHPSLNHILKWLSLI